MINFIIYDQQGTIVQQGSSDRSQVASLKKHLGDLQFLEILEPLSSCNAYYVEDSLVKLRSEENVADIDYAFTRHHNYASIGNQLDLLYKDIQAGLFGDAAKTGQFATHILAVKQQYPKP